MATAANSSPSNHSPRFSSDNNSPQTRRSSSSVSSPWTRILRGDSESITAVPSSPSPPSRDATAQDQIMPPSDCLPVKALSLSASPDDCAGDTIPENSDNGVGNGNAGKKPAWNKPSNGAVEVGPVMGADSWPALSESTRASGKTPSDSSKIPSDGSLVPASQATVIASSTSSSSPQKPVVNNVNSTSTSNITLPARQKSMKRGGGSAPVANGLPQAPASPGTVVELPHSNPSRDHTHRGTTWESGQRGSQSHSSNDHSQQRSSFRRGNGGPHPRGDGSYHHNYGGRRDHDRGNHDWNPHRNFNGRDAHMQPHRVVPRGFIRPLPHTATPFINPPPVRPFGTPIAFEMPSPMVYIPPESFRGGMPFIAPMPPPAMIFTGPDPQLHAKIVNQIDYYFSNENLIRDTFLRQNMDDQGWVPIKLIAGFKKVMLLTDNIQLILDALRTSNVVEVQSDKVRKRNDWMRWIMPPVQFPSSLSPWSVRSSSPEMLVTHVQSVPLEESTNYSVRAQADIRAEAFIRSSSGDVTNQPQTSSGEETGQGIVQGGSDSSIPARNSNRRELC